jgi:hypothetical protein
MATILINNATSQSVIRRSESAGGINASSSVSYQVEASPLNSENVLSYASGLQDDSGSIADMSTGVFVAAMDAALEVIQSPYPIISMKGNEWLGKSFHVTDKATLTDIVSVFDGDDLEQMRNFWVSEHATQAGHCGGGLQYLTARTFQNAEGGVIDGAKTPEYPEARWQFENFLLYLSMSDKQRQRQACINQTILGLFQQQTGSFFRHTHIPSYKDQSRIYGKTGKQSIWNNLPIPPVEDIDGVAYVSPLNIVKFLFAHGIPVDDMLVEFHDSEQLKKTSKEQVFYVSDCLRAKQWRSSIVAESKKDDLVASKMKSSVASWLVKWKDGFGHSRVKNFRGSTDAQSLTCSPPKHLINAG